MNRREFLVLCFAAPAVAVTAVGLVTATEPVELPALTLTVKPYKLRTVFSEEIGVDNRCRRASLGWVDVEYIAKRFKENCRG